MQPAYFDNNATTQVVAEAREAMLPYLGEIYGNPSSSHSFGEKARSGVEQAREQVASLLHTRPERIIFTSGATEGNNAALFSAIVSQPGKKHLISSQVEHASVLAPLRFLASLGYEVQLLPVDGNGGLDLAQLSRAIRHDTALVTLMGANNETGVLWPVDKIGEICREKKVLFHCDAVQMAGKLPLAVDRLAVDYLTVSGHKLHGPKGVGALYVQRAIPVHPLIMGADQENGRRAGTENVPAIVGFGKACDLAGVALSAGADERLRLLRDRLEQGIVEKVADVLVNGRGTERLSNTLNISCKYCSSAGLIQDLDDAGIIVSAHSACLSGDLDPSHVLRAMGVTEEYIHGTLRISLSRLTTAQEVERFLQVFPGLVAGARSGFAR